MNRTRQHTSVSCLAVSSVRPTAAYQCLVWLLIAVLLASYGCAPKTVPALPLTALSLKPSAPGGGSAQTVQASPEYRQAVHCFAHRDYRQALSLIDRLLAEPQFAQDASGCSFLRSQQAICRHALNPHALTSQVQTSSIQNSHTLNQTYPTSPPVAAATPVTAAAPVAASAPLASSADCGPRALLLACQTLGTPATLEELRRQAGTTAQGTSMAGLAEAARSVGLKAQGVQMDTPAIRQLSSPALAWVDGNHYVALLSVQGEQATIHDPNKAEEEVLTLHMLLQRSGGILLTLSR